MSLEHPAGQTGVYRPVSQDVLLLPVEKLPEKGNFAGTPAGCLRDTWPSRRGFRKFMRFFLPFEQEFKQTERNSGGNQFRLNRQIISRKIFARN